MRYILVHGMGHGAWCFDKTKTDLEGLGHVVEAVDLPLTSFEEDVAEVVAVLSAGEPAVLVGHSYGGKVISKVADNNPAQVTKLVYIAAIMVASTQSFDALNKAHPSKMFSYAQIEDGMVSVSTEGAMESFYACCDQAEAEAACEKLRPTALKCIDMRGESPEPWQQIDSSYVICLQDKAILPAVQFELAKNAATVIEIDTDHSPFMSARSELLAALAS